MKESPAFLAFDLGAESGLAVFGRLQGTPAGKLELQEIHRFPNGPVSVGNPFYWDALRLWSEIKHGLTLAIREAGNLLVSLGAYTRGVGFALLDSPAHQTQPCKRWFRLKLILADGAYEYIVAWVKKQCGWHGDCPSSA